jgi:outer membrane protein assembly factor BamB
MVVDIGSTINAIAPSPDGERVYVGVGTETHCYDMSGALVWNAGSFQGDMDISTITVDIYGDIYIGTAQRYVDSVTQYGPSLARLKPDGTEVWDTEQEWGTDYLTGEGIADIAISSSGRIFAATSGAGWVYEIEQS